MLIAATSVALLVVCAEAWALTIDQPGSDALLRAAGFIFEGRVLHVDPSAGGSGDSDGSGKAEKDPKGKKAA